MNEEMQKIKNEIAKAFIGQEKLIDYSLITLLADGHLLIEGVPGLGKTLLVRAIAKAIGGDAKRVQFTPDLMPSDITGNIMFDIPSGKFFTRKGPIFTNLFIADEINRAPAKTQSALFEAMQEFQVSLDGQTNVLPSPFMVLATENPLEHEGTYPLPDAQKDRFLMKVIIDYPQIEEEKIMVNKILDGKSGAYLDIENVNTIISSQQLCAIREQVYNIRVEPLIIDYAVRLNNATRKNPALETGAGPRGSIALIRCAKALAFLQGRNYTIPDDIKALAVPVLAHRITLSSESELEGLDCNKIIQIILSKVEAPRGLSPENE
jgi:MoxR-like ATPase